MKRFMVITDLIVSFFAFMAAYVLRNTGPFVLFLDHVQPVEVYLLALPIALVLLLLTLNHFSLYQLSGRVTALSEIYNLLRAVLFWVLFLMSASYLVKYEYSRVILILYGFTTFVFIMGGRLLLRHIGKNGWGKRRVITVGKGKLSRYVKQWLTEYAHLDFELVKNAETMDIKEINRMLEKNVIHELWIVDDRIHEERVMELVTEIANHRVTVRLFASTFNMITGRVGVNDFDHLPALQLARITPGFWYLIAKRSLDISIGSIFFILTFPLWIVIGICIAFDSPGPMIFSQRRIGLNGSSFRLYKFRTMKINSAKNAPAPKTAQDPRITRIGKFLRRTSLDELPQLVNVIRGDMSLVGPRPEMPFIVKQYKRWQKKRLIVKPGLTGLWQIMGRKDLPLSKHLEYDFYYLTNQSLLFDLAILCKTAIYVIQGKGAY